MEMNFMEGHIFHWPFDVCFVILDLELNDLHFEDNIFKYIFFQSKLSGSKWDVIEIYSWGLYEKKWINISVPVMAWYATGNRLLPKLILIKMSDVMWCLSATLS